MSDDLEFIVIDDIPEYIFCIGDDEENEQVIAISGKDGAFKYEKVAELPTTGEDGVLYLVPKSHTTQTASGNPISVNITDNAGKIESLKLDGNTTQQTYTGKNLLVLEGNTDNGVTGTVVNGNTVTVTGKATATSAKVATSPIHIPAGTYTISIDRTYANVVNVILGTNNGTVSFRIASGQTSATATLTADAYDASMWVGLTNGTTYNETFKLQLVAGSTADYDYEPYVGGQASPSPSYPQDINVVTGTQTVSINGANYPISLGSIELCKLGTYQDYIWKDGDDWKVHKATVSAIIDGSENWGTFGTNTLYVANIYSKIGNSIQSVSAGEMYASHFTIADIAGSNSLVGASLRTDATQDISNLRIRLQDMSGGTAGLKQMLSAKKPSIYARRLTPTDTIITDTTLIAQLEAVRTAALETGTNTISNTATGSNLAGDLELGYYGYDPLNKYDKYFWLDIDGGYESL